MTATRLAQSEERSTFNRVVVGSIPTSGAILFLVLVEWLLFERAKEKQGMYEIDYRLKVKMQFNFLTFYSVLMN
jgi:hypothetical protein